MFAHYELMKVRHDDLMRAAARHRLAAQARRPRIRHTLSRPAASA
jgi:hypothetical protein